MCSLRSLRGTLPPRLLLETLCSLQFILFPCLDPKSTRLLEELVRGKGSAFDGDCLSYDGHVRQMPPDFEYVFWGKRLSQLNDLIVNPRPRDRISQWVQRHTSERNALYVAIIGLFLSAFFGFLSVVIGGVQTWIAYKQWKTPQSTGSETSSGP